MSYSPQKRRAGSKSLLTTVEKRFCNQGKRLVGASAPSFGCARAPHAPLHAWRGDTSRDWHRPPARARPRAPLKASEGSRKTLIICGLIHFACNLIKYWLEWALIRNDNSKRWVYLSMMAVERDPNPSDQKIFKDKTGKGYLFWATRHRTVTNNFLQIKSLSWELWAWKIFSAYGSLSGFSRTLVLCQYEMRGSRSIARISIHCLLKIYLLQFAPHLGFTSELL